jgi:C4-dicarboxylate-specific signal transduction histidine kinase
VDEDELVLRVGRLALVGRLARGIGHELNNPLFVVLGLVELVLRDVEPGTKAHERLSLVLSTGNEIKDLVAAVLEVARDEQPGEAEPVALDGAAREAAQLARRFSLSKEVEIEERYPPEPVMVLARARELRRLLLTLLALPQRGVVTLEVEPEGAVRVAAEAPAPADAALELRAAALAARTDGGSLELAGDGPLRAVLRLPLV